MRCSRFPPCVCVIGPARVASMALAADAHVQRSNQCAESRASCGAILRVWRCSQYTEGSRAARRFTIIANWRRDGFQRIAGQTAFRRAAFGPDRGCGGKRAISRRAPMRARRRHCTRAVVGGELRISPHARTRPRGLPPHRAQTSRCAIPLPLPRAVCPPGEGRVRGRG